MNKCKADLKFHLGFTGFYHYMKESHYIGEGVNFMTAIKNLSMAIAGIAFLTIGGNVTHI